MNKIILDLSANTFKNDKTYVKRMIDEVYKIDTRKHEVIFKTQLFESAGDNIVLDHDVFDYMYNYANSLGYKVTSSVFDLPSLKFLLGYKIPFVKIANNRGLDYLVNYIPRGIAVYVSVGDKKQYKKMEDKFSNSELLCCISDYNNATMADYDLNHHVLDMSCKNISDHTHNWDLYHKYKPHVYECHYILEDSDGLDAGPFSRTPEMLREVL